MDRLIGMPRRVIVTVLLIAFGAWDLMLAFATIVTPGVWFRWFHDTAYIDPQALLSRTGAVWLAFGVFQLYAWRVWQRQPYWLAVVGGMRLSELFADWTYLFRADAVTPFGARALLLATPSNVFFAWFFISTAVTVADAQLREARQAAQEAAG